MHYTFVIHLGLPSGSVIVPPKCAGNCDASMCSNIFGNHFFDSLLNKNILLIVYSSKNFFTILKTNINTFGTESKHYNKKEIKEA